MQFLHERFALPHAHKRGLAYLQLPTDSVRVGMASEAPAGPSDVGAGVKSVQEKPYSNCRNLGALRWLLMYGQGKSVRPYASRALALVSPIVALAAALVVFAPGIIQQFGPRAAQAAGVTQGLRYLLAKLETSPAY